MLLVDIMEEAGYAICHNLGVDFADYTLCSVQKSSLKCWNDKLVFLHHYSECISLGMSANKSQIKPDR